MSTEADENIRLYMARLEIMLRPYQGDDGMLAAVLNSQLSEWERKERRLAEWARSKADIPCPFNSPLDAITCARIIAELSRLLADVRTKIKARIVKANEAIGVHL